MDAIKVLGGLLGNKRMARDVGRDVLDKILGHDKKKRRQSPRTGAGYSSRSQGRSTGAYRGSAYGGGGRRGSTYRGGTVNRGPGYATGLPYQREYVQPGLRNRQAVLLIQAMINAAKADGNIDREEYNTIFEQTYGLGPSELAFLRQELNSPLNLQQFLAEIPRGLEVEVYQVSIAAIRPDCPHERQYLQDLAQGLGLTRHTCNQIHRRMGLPLW